LASKRIAVVGGGITGLATAFHLERMTDASVDIYEGAPRLGGKVWTERRCGYLVEEGPDCFFARKPGALELVRELGLEGELIEPERRQFSMLIDGRLHRVPSGLVSLNQVQPDAVTKAWFLSVEAKTRVLAEPEQPVGTSSDESIRSFFSRRFGSEFSRLVAEPLLAGTHGGDADRLSMRALYPGYLEAEQRFGCLSGSAPAALAGPSFLSFRGGMRALVERITESLTRTCVHLGCSVGSLDELSADRVVVTVPGPAAASLLPASVPVGEIPHRSSAILTLAFSRSCVANALDGTGFLVPEGESGPVSGATWSSRKWAGRAPEDCVLLRLFLRDVSVSELSVLEWLRPLLGISGAPLWSDLRLWRSALPQYTLGHLDRVASVESALRSCLPHVTVAGTSYRGVGVPDCLRQGREAATLVADSL